MLAGSIERTSSFLVRCSRAKEFGRSEIKKKKERNEHTIKDGHKDVVKIRNKKKETYVQFN